MSHSLPALEKIPNRNKIPININKTTSAGTHHSSKIQSAVRGFCKFHQPILRIRKFGKYWFRASLVCSIFPSSFPSADLHRHHVTLPHHLATTPLCCHTTVNSDLLAKQRLTDRTENRLPSVHVNSSLFGWLPRRGIDFVDTANIDLLTEKVLADQTEN